MTLDWLLTTVSLLCLGYAVFSWLYGQVGAAKTVSRSSPQRTFKLRSRRSARSNALNAGSGRPDAVQPPVNVQPNVQGSAPNAVLQQLATAPTGGLLITPNELQQLAEALGARASGATVEEALARGFSVKKGGSAGYRRAKELFDTATAPPATLAK